LCNKQITSNNCSCQTEANVNLYLYLSKIYLTLKFIYYLFSNLVAPMAKHVIGPYENIKLV